MKLLSKIFSGILALGAINGVVFAYLFKSNSGPRIIRITTPRGQDKRRMNSNPMEDPKKRRNYLVCKNIQTKKKEITDVSKYCREKWFK